MPQKLLLADDSVTIQRVIELTFADEDIQVIAVGDGQQAIARIDAERPDVILADVGMPERDGYEVASHVKGNPETAHIPVLLLTGAFEPIDEARARAVGCDGVLVKPFEPQMVINRVKDLLAGRRPESLWSTLPGATGPVVTPHPGASVPPVVGTAPGTDTSPGPTTTSLPGTESLDEYFDRLDAAFAEGEAASAARSSSAASPSVEGRQEHESEFGSWDIAMDRPRTPAAPASPFQSHALRTPGSVPGASPDSSDRPSNEVPAIAPESSPVAQAPELADAFAALLAAEEQFAAAPPNVPAPGALSGLHAAAAPANDEAIEAAVRRVLSQMTDETVKSIVLDVAERLVRAEIDRIKSQAKL